MAGAIGWVGLSEGLNVDPAELKNFDELASRWWEPGGEFKPLRWMNPVRLAFVEDQAGLAGKRCLVFGCGDGLLSAAGSASGLRRGSSVAHSCMHRTGTDASVHVRVVMGTPFVTW